MSDLVEFLWARLAGDERIACAAIADDCGQDDGFGDADWLTDVARVRPRFGDAAAALIREFAVPARVLREVEAKRWIIDEHEVADQGCETCGNYDPTGLHAHETDGPCATLRLLALPYADHEDFREEWRP
jgi:hypothetical protein